jgi:hypothetical protein
MILILLAAIVAGACVAASARRLRIAQAPTALDPVVLLEALRGEKGRAELARVRRAIASAPDAEWERGLLAALDESARARAALVNEQLTDLDLRLQEWARVPRVCASIASSGGFLLAALTLRSGLLGASAAEAMDRASVDDVVFRAIDVAALGVAGAVVCAAIHIHAGKLSKARMEATDRLVERLESLIPARPAAAPGGDPDP